MNADASANATLKRLLFTSDRRPTWMPVVAIGGDRRCLVYRCDVWWWWWSGATDGAPSPS